MMKTKRKKTPDPRTNVTSREPVPQSQKLIITVSYYSSELPVIDLPEALKETVEVRFIDLMEKDFLVLKHAGRKIFRTYKGEHGGIVQEWADFWFSTEIWTDWESDTCFDIRDLPTPSESELEVYRTMYPESPLQQRLAYAIDQGLISEDGLDSSEPSDAPDAGNSK